MKPLIITAGDDCEGKYIVDAWLPSLRENGQYKGDALILDYDLSQEYWTHLLEQSNVHVEKAKKIFDCIPTDRYRAVYELLLKNFLDYDIILCIDGDVKFLKPIQPLFEMAKEKLCYVKNVQLNGDWIPLNTSAPLNNEYWNTIRNEYIINAGMHVAPRQQILQVGKFVTEHLRWGNTFGFDQLWLNAFIYYYKPPSQAIEDIWNYDNRMGYARKDGKCYTNDGQEIAILHFIQGKKEE